MYRKDFLRMTTATIAGLSIIPISSIKSKMNNELRLIRRDVGYFTARGGTIGWYITNNAMMFVDSQYPKSAEECLTLASKKTQRTPDILINTHHHRDHTAGNGVIGSSANMLVAHQNVPKFQKKYERDDNPQVYASTLYQKKLTLLLDDEKIHLTYFGQAHTSGDSVIYFERANIIHMGDLVFNGIYPYIDRDSGASISNWITLLNMVVKDYPKDAIYIFGHGTADKGITGSYEDVNQAKFYLESLFNTVMDGIEKDKTLAEIQNISTLPHFEQLQSFGTNLSLVANIDAAYQEITKGVVNVY